MNIIDHFDEQYFKAKLHFLLRHNSLNSDDWEKLIAESTKSTWIKGSRYLADAYNPTLKQCISVKTRKIDPMRKKRIDSSDFLTVPSKFHFGGLKDHEADLDNLHTVSRRCSIPGLDEQTSSAEEIGAAAIKDYVDFEEISLQRFNCDSTVDVVIVHGESLNSKSYLVRVMFFDHMLNKIKKWEDIQAGRKSKYKGKRMKILGYDQHGPHLGRNGSLGRQQTCMIRFYRKDQALKILEFSVPLPKREKFDFNSELKLMNK